MSVRLLLTQYNLVKTLIPHHTHISQDWNSSRFFFLHNFYLVDLASKVKNVIFLLFTLNLLQNKQFKSLFLFLLSMTNVFS